jgi:hypothetical protein
LFDPLFFQSFPASHAQVAMTLTDMQSMLSVLIFLLANTTAEYLVLSLPDEHKVTLTIGTLVDYTRNNSDAAAPTPRALMLSVFQSARCTSTVPVSYMPNKSAEYQ